MTPRADDAPPRAERPLLSLVVFLAATALAAVVGGVAASGAQETYAALALPPFAPPAWLFGPAWSVLYVLIALAGWLVWRRAGWGLPIALWILQLVLNAAWTPLFFGGGLYGWALAEILVLWLVVLLCVWVFRAWRPVAALLLLPYAAWVAYAAALNLGIVVLN
ncbi:TspO/MBR family protein [Brachybacterium hainanense]|uniref:TspO/MBR family protein n=1 Tax=Brachybacterium hainanense TaxID=1541174 RepID=A0ABV6RBL9_9MICO